MITEAKDQNLTAPFPGDAILHISSRRSGANKCLWMDAPPPVERPGTIDGFEVYGTEIAIDEVMSVIGNSWRLLTPLKAA